ncbi:hypothetical protein D3C81_1748330 [compost metagenome]
MATNAASTPFSMAGISDLPKYSQEAMSAARPPAAAAILVVKATWPKNPPIGDNALPGLNPNQPNHRMITPRTVNTWLWPGIITGLPSLLNLPRRGLSRIVATTAAVAPVRWTTVEPA